MRTPRSRAAATKRGANCAGRHHLVARGEQHVVGHLELGIDHDPEQPVAADREREQLRVLAARAGHDRAVRQHQAEASHRRAERPVRHRPAMRIDRKRAADAEIVVRLRHRRREAERIERRDHVAPARPGAHAHDAPRRVRLDHRRGERGRKAVAHQALPAHRMARAADADRPPFRGRILQQCAQPRDQRIVARRRSIALRATGTGLSRLASLSTSGSACLRRGAAKAAGASAAAPAAATNVRRDRRVMRA